MAAIESPTVTSAQSTRSRRRPEFWQPRQPVFWLYLALFVPSLGLIGFAIVSSSLANPLGLIAVAGLVGVQVVLLWWITRSLSRFHRRSRSLSIAAVLWGGVIAIAMATFFNPVNISLLSSRGLGSVAASIAAPIDEDLLRFAGVLIILVLAYRRPLTVMDGVVYGFLVGAGFEVIENIFYVLQSEDLASTLSTGFLRLLVGFALHALWSACTGAVLAYCLSRAQRGLSGRWAWLLLAIVVPMLLHAAWDAPGVSVLVQMKFVVAGLLYAIVLVLFFTAVRWGRRSEFAYFSEQTGSDLSIAEFKRLPRDERRRLSRSLA